MADASVSGSPMAEAVEDPEWRLDLDFLKRLSRIGFEASLMLHHDMSIADLRKSEPTPTNTLLRRALRYHQQQRICQEKQR